MNHLCKRCGDNDPDNFYKTNGAKTKCKKCHTMEVHHSKRMIKMRGVEKLGGKCFCCGYDKSAWALEFHHKDPSIKDFHWGDKRTSWSTLEKELDKCILLCSNCHKEKHEAEWRETLVKHHPAFDQEDGPDGKAADC